MSFGFGVGDILTVSQFAIQLYESCSNAPGQFAELRDQAKSLTDGLEVLQTHLTSRPTVAQHGNVLRVVAGFKPILRELDTLIAKRRRLESKGFQLWERLRWPGNQKLTELRSRLDYQLSLLMLHLGNLASSNQRTDRKVLEAKVDSLTRQLELAYLPKQVGWQFYDLEDIARVVIPPFFLLGTSLRPRSSHGGLNLTRRSLGSCKIRFNWDIMRLQTRLGQSSSSTDVDLNLGTSKALSEFQQTFRDREMFRYGLLQIVAAYMRAHPDPSSPLQKATKIVILSHLVAHAPNKIRFETSDVICTPNELDEVLMFLKDEMSAMLQGLMFSTMRKLLSELDDMCRSGNPADWPTIYLSLGTILSAAESLAVDRYMREPEHLARRSVKEMEESVIFHISGHLQLSNRGRHPLDLDWSLSKNKALVNNDPAALYALRRLQKFREIHMTFIEQQCAAEYGSGNSTSMTGKMVSRMLS